MRSSEQLTIRQLTMNTIKIKIDDYGNMIINTYDLLSCMSPEEIEKVVCDVAWYVPIAEHLAEVITGSYARDGFNECIHIIREKVLSDDSIPEMLRNWVRGKINDCVLYKEKGQFYMDAYYNLYLWLREKNYDLFLELPKFPEPNYHSYSDEAYNAALQELRELGVDVDGEMKY